MSPPMPLADSDVLDRWPHLWLHLYVGEDGAVDNDFLGWTLNICDLLSPAEQSAAYEQWADYFQWRLAQRADELAADPNLRHIVEKWTDSMAYICRRMAAFARGGEPGEWVPQHERRPDLCR